MSKRLKIKNEEIVALVAGESPAFPKYATQIMNLANGNAQGTRPRVVGQMSDLIQAFPGRTLSEWRTWYTAQHPTSIEEATNKVYSMVEKFKAVIGKIDEDMVRKWVEDLVITKTYAGLRFQEAVLAKVAEELRTQYRVSTPQDESKGIDGYVGDRPISIKPSTYKSKTHTLSERIDAMMVFYEKRNDGLVIEFDI